MNMIKCALQISKGSAQRGRTEGAVLPVRRSAPEHNPYMTLKQHSTTARWIRLGVNFELLSVAFFTLKQKFTKYSEIRIARGKTLKTAQNNVKVLNIYFDFKLCTF